MFKWNPFKRKQKTTPTPVSRLAYNSHDTVPYYVHIDTGSSNHNVSHDYSGVGGSYSGGGSSGSYDSGSSSSSGGSSGSSSD